ncbi:pyridoxal phosphate-dependent transferase [Lentinula aciculospora]|uniref:Pyridoxal phosphate-dependent transferase n=1 Tax=Lentinula aciculospora TaxID=153920 RepID=A0A9W9A0P8_9AGAR|nr:pyridoxal phosphate-dependent transferase [Lentinula aciculospora]
MGNSQSNNAQKKRSNSALQTKNQINSSSNASQNLPFLQIDPKPNLVHPQVVRRRHSSITTSSSNTARPLRHQRSASSILFSRLGRFGYNSATGSVLSRESGSDSSDLFDGPHVDDDKIRVVHLSQYSDEPPTSPSTTTFSKNSQPTSSSLLPCSPPSHLAYYTPTNADGRQIPVDSAAERAYDAFLRKFPQYRLTWILDTLRRTDYTRLSRTSSSQHEIETYVDYMGGSLYPESLIRVHTEFLASNVLGNTHSISASSRLSLKQAEEARRAILEFFGAPSSSDSDDDPHDYTVIFTPNASGALKLVGEAYQFSKSSTFVLSTDSHNSVNGIREFARRGGARVVYVPAGGQKGREGAFDLEEGKRILRRNKPPKGTSSLLALTGLSNITNAKCPALSHSSGLAEDGSIVAYARSLGYHTLLDAAALAPTSRISLTQLPVDALAVSFYKMFGFPTGVGALVIRKGFLRLLSRGRPWFAGGTVDVVQVPGKVRTMKGIGEEFEGFEDGTINYLLLPAVTSGLHLLSAYLPFLPLRLNCLLHYLVAELGRIQHRDGDGRLINRHVGDGTNSTEDQTGLPVCRVLSRIPKKVLKAVGETDEDAGAVISCVFLDEAGETLPLSFIAHSAAHEGISLRTGCMCNPGGAAALLGIQESMKDVEEGGMMREGMTLREFEEDVERERRRRGTLYSANPNQRALEELRGRMELGVVRISLGLGSDWSDLWRLLQWAKRIGDARQRKVMWKRWLGGQAESLDDWQEVEGGAIRRRDVVVCKGIGKDATCVQHLSMAEDEEWDVMVGRAI